MHPSSGFLLAFVYVCVYVHTHAHMQVHVPVYMWRPEEDVRCHGLSLCLIPLRQESLSEPEVRLVAISPVVLPLSSIALGLKA